MKRWAALGLAAGLLAACGERLAGGGDASETGSARVSGQVLKEDGQPVAGAEILILSSDYDPVSGGTLPDAQKGLTDSGGRYNFGKLRGGAYTLQFQHRGLRTRGIVFGIKLRTDMDSATAPNDTLRAPGSLSVPLPESPDTGVGYVFIRGTTFRKRVDSEMRAAGSVVMDSLPPGLMPSLEYTLGEAASVPVQIASDVGVPSGRTTHVDAYATWAHTARLTLNTAAGGVAIASDQTDFPLLVRLSAPAFDFSGAAPGGADLRFSKADGTPLVREISAWDARAGHAEIWVRMDTVHAGMASQHINMHWGKSGVAAPAARRPVFDTSAGFAGVWHLDEEAADTLADGLYHDATGSGGDGDDRIRNQTRTGVAGAGHGLDSGDYIQARKPFHGLKPAAHFTLCAWYRNTGNNGRLGGEILNVGDNYGIRVRNDSVVHVWYWPATPSAGSKTDWNEVTVKSADFIDGKWHQLCGTFDGSTLRLYVDGNEQGSGAFTDPIGLQFPINVTMGKHGNGKAGFEFRGDIDETQVHSQARDADWIKLSFENQKANGTFPALTLP